MIKNSDLAYKLKDLIKGGKSVLDVGCQYGTSLYPFIDLGFTRLHGIDNSLRIEQFIAIRYARYKFNYAEKVESSKKNKKGEYRIKNLNNNQFPNQSVKFNWPEIYKEFEKITFDIGKEKGDIINFEFKNKYDVIILQNILHFFDRTIRLKIIRKLKLALNKNGLIYIYANSQERFIRYGTNLNNAIKIDEKTYQETIREKRIFHLLNCNDFREIEMEFDFISNIKVIDKVERLGEEVIGIMR